MFDLNRYAKAVTAVVATVLVALVPYMAQGQHVTSAQWVNVTIVGLGAVMVYLAPNLPGDWGYYTKSIVAALTAAAMFLATLIGTGSFYTVTSAEWLQVILAGLGALGVLGIPNSAPPVPMSAGSGETVVPPSGV